MLSQMIRRAAQVGGSFWGDAGTASYRAVSTEAVVSSGNLTLWEPSGSAFGDLLVAVIGVRGSATFTLPADWNLVESFYDADVTSTTTSEGGILMAWIQRGSSAPDLKFVRSGGDLAQGSIMGWSRDSGEFALRDSDITSNTESTLTKVSSAIGYENGDVVVAGWSIPGNLSSPTLAVNLNDSGGDILLSNSQKIRSASGADGTRWAAGVVISGASGSSATVTGVQNNSTRKPILAVASFDLI
jgi:hypothetical protein